MTPWKLLFSTVRFWIRPTYNCASDGWRVVPVFADFRIIDRDASKTAISRQRPHLIVKELGVVEGEITALMPDASAVAICHFIA